MSHMSKNRVFWRYVSQITFSITLNKENRPKTSEKNMHYDELRKCVTKGRKGQDWIELYKKEVLSRSIMLLTVPALSKG